MECASAVRKRTNNTQNSCALEIRRGIGICTMRRRSFWCTCSRAAEDPLTATGNNQNQKRPGRVDPCRRQLSCVNTYEWNRKYVGRKAWSHRVSFIGFPLARQPPEEESHQKQLRPDCGRGLTMLGSSQSELKNQHSVPCKTGTTEVR